jgi:hypothetical protein
MPRMRTMNYLRARLYRPGAQVDARRREPEARAMPGTEPLSPGPPLGLDGGRADGRAQVRGRRNGIPWTPYVWRGDTPGNRRRRAEADAAFDKDQDNRKEH